MKAVYVSSPISIQTCGPFSKHLTAKHPCYLIQTFHLVLSYILHINTRIRVLIPKLYYLRWIFKPAHPLVGGHAKLEIFNFGGTHRVVLSPGFRPESD